MTAFDTHAHLFWSDFKDDVEEVVSRAVDAGVMAILNLGTTIDTSRTCIKLAEQYELCWAGIGYHPHDIKEINSDYGGALEALMLLSKHPEVIAVGETGLDFFRGRVDEEMQLNSLEIHFELARKTGLPIVLHNRGANRELREILEEYDSKVTAILHCFVGDEEFGRWAIGRGHFIGLGGIFTFPSSNLSGMVKRWDIDHLLLETDSPFLSPVPYRGRRNEPAYIVHTGHVVAEALDMGVNDLMERTTANACRLFGVSLQKPGGERKLDL